MYTFPADTSDHNKFWSCWGNFSLLNSSILKVKLRTEGFFYEYLTETPTKKEDEYPEHRWGEAACNFDDLVWNKGGDSSRCMSLVWLILNKSKGLLPSHAVWWASYLYPQSASTRVRVGRIHLRLNKWVISTERNGNLGLSCLRPNQNHPNENTGILEHKPGRTCGLVQRFYLVKFSVKKADAAAKA
jgi:hypothetical protein